MSTGFLAGVPGKLATLAGRLSAAWAAKLDTLAADYTTARAVKLDNLNRLDVDVSSRLGSIKSIQSGTIAVVMSAVATGSATGTVASVNTAKSVLIYLGHASNKGNSSEARLTLTNATTITANCSHGNNVSTSCTVAVSYLLVEFN